MGEVRVLLFGGTIEGREIAAFLSMHKVPTLVYVATAYGKELVEQTAYLQVVNQRLTKEKMEALMATGLTVVDATHPYATEVTVNIRDAATRKGCRYIRVLRPVTHVGERDVADTGSLSGRTYADSTALAISYLNKKKGNILLTTGSKSLPEYAEVDDYKTRLYARVLPIASVVSACNEAGFTGNHLICMQGPFSAEMNLAMIKQYDIRYMVTKDTGMEGGFPEKEAAAEAAGVELVIIGRPVIEKGVSVYQCKHMLCEQFHITGNPEIAIVGIGAGQKSGMTIEANRAVEEAQLVVGASKRMLSDLSLYEKEIYLSYKADDIASYIIEHPEYDKIVVLFSGDTGFHSGTRKLLQVLQQKSLRSVMIYPGISSLSLFCARVKIPWDDIYVVSLHGKDENVIGEITNHKKVFCILGKEEQVQKICRKLIDYHMENVRVTIGEKLSYTDEKISTGYAKDFVSYKTDKLAVVLFTNDAAERMISHGIDDEDFLRDKVPMTKEEIRSISISKLNLRRDSIIYDIGAGSGSVSIEMARLSYQGTVYAIEKKPEAVSLIEKNKKKFKTDNIIVVSGSAPDVLTELPTPTHAFIGGSSGNLREICQLLLHKNPNLCLVINAITLETVSEALSVLKDRAFIKTEIVQIQAAKAKEVASYHMMLGANPVTIIKAIGGGSSI